MQWFFDIVVEMVRAAGMFVWRGGSAGYDFILGDLTLDNAWHDLNLIAIVPEHANGVLLSVDLRCTLAAKRVDFRHSAADGIWSVATLRTQAANVRYSAPVPVPIDSDRVCQYKFNVANFNVANLTVVGWWF